MRRWRASQKFASPLQWNKKIILDFVLWFLKGFYLPKAFKVSSETKICAKNVITVSTVMSTAKRLVLSLAGRKDCQQTSGASSTRLVGNSLSPGHELDEIAIVSHGKSPNVHISYGTLSLNEPRYILGEIFSISFPPRSPPLERNLVKLVVDRRMRLRCIIKIHK